MKSCSVKTNYRNNDQTYHVFKKNGTNVFRKACSKIVSLTARRHIY